MERRIFLATLLSSTRLPGGWLFKNKYSLTNYVTNNLHSSLRKHPNKTKIINRYVKVIKDAAQKYNISETIIAKVIKAESGFRWWAKSHKGAAGPMQVMTKVWSGRIHKMLDKNKKMEALRSENPLQVYEKYVKQIGIGIDVGTSILDYYIRKHTNVALAIMAFHRGDSRRVVKFQQALKDINVAYEDDYVLKIL